MLYDEFSRNYYNIKIVNKDEKKGTSQWRARVLGKQYWCSNRYLINGSLMYDTCTNVILIINVWMNQFNKILIISWDRH